VNTFLTLDGVMQAPGGPEEDPTGGFEHGGWVAGYWDDEAGQVMDEFMGKPFDLVLGRKTYEIFAAYWPFVDQPYAKPLNDATKHVASRTLTNLEWQPSVLIEGDVAESVAALKQQDGPELQVHGSANLLQTLLRSNLIDEFNLWTFPVVVGGGKRLFADGAVPSGLKLEKSKTFSSGVIMANYSPAGEIVSGSFGLDEPSEAELERRRNLEG
jgi:dihydrofolate reductase